MSYNYNNTIKNKININPLVFKSLKDLDVDQLEDDLARELQRSRITNEKEKVYYFINLREKFQKSSKIPKKSKNCDNELN